MNFVAYDKRRDRLAIISPACRCHPFDLIIQWGKGFRQSVTISFNDAKSQRRYLRYQYTKVGVL